jgi:hypothetical protein
MQLLYQMLKSADSIGFKKLFVETGLLLSKGKAIRLLEPRKVRVFGALRFVGGQ